MSNGTCHAHSASEQSPPLFQNGNVVVQGDVSTICENKTVLKIAQQLTINENNDVSDVMRPPSPYLILGKDIVRILFMVPIYAIVSLASYLFLDHATPLLLIRDGYESTVLTSFFYLLLTYLSPDTNEQKNIFHKAGLSKQKDRVAIERGEPTKKWMFPLGFVKAKPDDGLYFLQIMKWGVLQYCVIRPTTTLAAVILDYAGLYCEASWSPGWGHVHITIIVSISVSVAMYCLIQLYIPVSDALKPQKPLLKLFAVKAVVFLTFWQATFLSLLSMFNVVKDTGYMTAEEINIGIGALLETFEMMLFAFLHIKAFSYKPYRSPYDPALTPEPRTPRLKALGHALDFRETLRELWAGCVYMYWRWTGRETDVSARRMAIMEGAFGRTRVKQNGGDGKAKAGNGCGIRVDMEEEVVVGEERQWLGVGDDYGYGLAFARRERSAGLADQIQTELEKRGYRDVVLQHHETFEPLTTHPRQQSWLRMIYDRFSNGEGNGDGARERLTSSPRRRERVKVQRRSRHSRGRAAYAESDIDSYDDPPQASLVGTYRTSERQREPISSPADLARHQQPWPPLLRAADHLHRADTVLARVFPHPVADTEASTNDGRSLTNVTSSQSHSSRVRLAAPPLVVPQQTGPTVRMPMISHGYTEMFQEGRAPRRAMDATSGAPSSPSMMPSRQHVGQTQSSGPPRSAPSRRQSHAPPSLHGQRVPQLGGRRPKIVLPARLSPVRVPLADESYSRVNSNAYNDTPSDDVLNPQPPMSIRNVGVMTRSAVIPRVGDCYSSVTHQPEDTIYPA